MKKLLLILMLLATGLGQSSDSLITFYTYPDFSNISNPKILSYGDDKVIVAGTNSNDEVSNILFLIIDHYGNMINSTEYPDQNYLIDFVTVPDGSYIIAMDNGLWRLVTVDNNFNFSFLTNEFNGNEITSISVNEDSTFNVTTTQSSPSEILQFDLDGELLSSFNVYDAEQDTYVNENFNNHIKTSDGGFLFFNDSSVYKTDFQGHVEWMNDILGLSGIINVSEKNGGFFIIGYQVIEYWPYDLHNVVIWVDEFGNEISSYVPDYDNILNSCILIEDGFIFTGFYSYSFVLRPIFIRFNQNLDEVLFYFASMSIDGSTTDMIRINENEFFSVGIGYPPPEYDNTLSIWHYYFEPLPELSNCTADDGTEGVELWEECYSIENTTNIFLTGPEIEDTIPPLIGNLVNLTSLEINWTGIHGNIPSEIGNLTNLTTLSLTGNSLSGEIPPELGNLTNLTTLSLSDNGLSGSIPSELGNLINLTNLNFFDTELSGGIPPELGNLINLNSLELHNNNLEGSIPSEIGNLISLTNLHLANNYLEGDVPLGIWDLNNLVELDLSTNQLTGSISSNIGSMTNLELLGLGENQLNGFIPESICELELNEFESIDLEYNQFCPPYPSCIEDYLGEQDTSNCENVSVLDDLIPYTYKLYSAYPNPFNPFTTLRYDLPEDGLVNITVYDLLGNVINQLVNEVQSSGYKSIQWNATNNLGQPVSAGVYLYSIEARDFRQTKKMILLK